MPRRKNAYLSDGSDSEASGSEASEGGFNSQEDEDSRAERALFEYSGRKRRRMGQGGKEAAWEGIFGEEAEDRRAGGRGLGARRGGRGGSSGRTDWTRAPAFVSKSDKPATGVEESGPAPLPPAKSESPEDSENEESVDSDDVSTSRPASPRVRDGDYEDEGTPHRGLGLGLGAKNPFVSSGSATPDVEPEPEPKPKIGGRAGIGASRGLGGLGAIARAAREGFPPPSSMGGIPSSSAASKAEEPARPADVPAAFGRPPPSLTQPSGPSRTQRSFVTQPAKAGAATPTQLTAKEAAHFRGIEGSWAARMLAGQGWAPGKGLGLNEDGRAVPVEVGKVLKGQGIQTGMRTEDSKREARRRGEVVSDEEDKPRRRGRKAHGGAPREPKPQSEQGWKKQRKVKVKVEHKTYEQLLAEAGDAAASGVGLLKEVQSLSALSLSTWAPTSDNMRLPELRHNLRLVVDVAKGDVDALAREGKSIHERRRWSLREEEISRKKINAAEQEIARLQNIQTIVAGISATVSKQIAASDLSLDPLTENFGRLLHDFRDEYTLLSLDEVVVGAIGQVLRRAFMEWQPFDVSSDVLLSSLKHWQAAYNLPSEEADHGALITNENQANGHRRDEADRSMTAWESLLWSIWLPKVRSAINNDWDPYTPHTAVHLLESWNPILPPFIRDNILDQLVLPKVKKAVEDWDPRRVKGGKAKSLAQVVFPWLPSLGERIEDVLDGAKRRIRSVLRNWVVKDGVPEELSRWRKDVYSSSEWDKLVLQYVVPKLGVCLREDFVINPRKQDLVPLEDWVLPWHALLRPSVFSHLLEVEFFPKWLDILYVWLVQPAYKPDEVANWFVWWKGRFPETVLEMRGVAHGFNQGLELMNDAMRLGTEAPTRLRKPVFKPLPPSKASAKERSTPTRKPQLQVEESTDITFRNLAEEYAARHDLIFLPLGRSHGTTGKPLFRISKGVDGRGGVTIYVGENAVFAQVEDGTFRAVSLEDMVKRAGA